MEGIVGYGAYIPRNRIKVEEIAKVWGADAPSYKKGLMLEEKSVPSPDQMARAMAMTPMAFWPSAVPWLQAMKAEDAICIGPKRRLTLDGLTR